MANCRAKLSLRKKYIKRIEHETLIVTLTLDILLANLGFYLLTIFGMMIMKSGKLTQKNSF